MPRRPLREERSSRWTASVTFPHAPELNTSAEDCRLHSVAEDVVLDPATDAELQRSVAACLEAAVDACGVGAGGESSGRVVKRMVDLSIYHEVAKKKDLRAKAAAAEHRLGRNYVIYQKTSPAFMNLQRLQEEQGKQMEMLIESSGGKADVETLVEAHAHNLAIAHNASEIGLKQLAHQQRCIYAQTLAAIALRNDDACPAIPLLKDPDEPAGGRDPAAPSEEGGGRRKRDADRPSASLGVNVPGAASLRTGQRAVGAALGKVRGALFRSPFDIGSADPSDPAVPGGRASPGTAEEAAPPTASTDIMMDCSSLLHLSVPTTTAVEGIRGMCVEMPVRVLNIKSTVSSYLAYGQGAHEQQAAERADTMKRIILDDIGAFIIPVSVLDIQFAGMERGARGRDVAHELSKDVCMALPQHVVDACNASAELVFSGLQDGIAEAVALNEDEVVPGMVIATQHSNMPWCQLLLIAVYHPRHEATLHAALEKAVLLSQGASQLFLDLTKVSGPASVRGIFGTALREKARSILSAAPQSVLTYPLHTPAALRDRDIPTLSIVLSASQLVLSRDFNAGPFSGFNPRYVTPAASPVHGSPRPQASPSGPR
eukprot:TRINITY_DN6547_c0_g1_i1.p1 TRINITY_DN6547_c0_g1~~TRINITY_DN6547_c0_g1_i1.p1  ORF type:complete len:623 (+),score=174.93 TRINITY_DN6547_c0_g1_i1:71-1870(+)